MQGFRLWDAPALVPEQWRCAKRRYCTAQDHARHLYVHCCPATALKDFGAGLSHTRNFQGYHPARDLTELDKEAKHHGFRGA
ncbi:hypothetical protein DTO271G3_6399 [Paecilomyces variotii]|nr:hypothetical protein DTO271G3_6399 [Paecilomyces variotii]